MRKIVLCVALLAFGGLNADVKIGTVNFNKSIEGSKQVAVLKHQMETKFKKRRDAIQADRTSIQKSIQDLHRNESVLSKSAIADKKAAIQKRVAKLEKQESTYQKDLLAFRSAQFEKIVKAFKSSVSTIAKKDGLNVVINDSAVVYSQSAVEDITNSVAQSLK